MITMCGNSVQFGILLAILITGTIATSGIYFDVEKSENFVGIVYENGIRMTKPLIAKINPSISKSRQVCNMQIIHHPRTDLESEFPFTFGSVNRTSGEGHLRVKSGLAFDYSKRKRYKFQVQAVDCDKPQHISNRVWVLLKIVPSEVPRWSKRSYGTTVPEGLPVGTRILQVKAFEMGRTAGNAICKYEISEPAGVPFTIDSRGVIVATKVLRVANAKHYHLRVTAYDCWEPRPRTSSVSVDVEVTKKCEHSQIKGLPVSKKYTAGSGVQRFASAFDVDACYKTACPSRLVTAEVSLIGHEGTKQQCDLDPSSIDSQRNMCGAEPTGVVLLPDEEQFLREAKGKVNETTKAYLFDGVRSAFEVPDSVVPSSHLLGKRFTLSFWLRHGVQRTKRKEQIVCNADGEMHNRHHYSVFLHNCKLILLLRKEYSPKETHKFSAAEWRFKLSEVCDSRWHHYALSYEQNKLKLYVDGHIFVPTKENFEVVDDYAMHNFRDVHFTRMMIGACWRSSSNHAVQHLKGELAGLILVRQAMESDHVIRCLNLCHEQLDFHAMDQMNPGMSVSLKADLTRIIVNGHNLREVMKLVRQIGYLNPRTRPVKASRRIQIDVDIRCQNESGAEVSRIEIPQRRMTIEITRGVASIPRIPLRLAADSGITVEREVLKTRGQALFPGLVVLPLAVKGSSPGYKFASAMLLGKAAAGASKNRVEPIAEIDSCTVVARPMLVPEIEQLIWPDEKPRPDGRVVCRAGARADSRTPEGIRRATERCVELLRGVRYRISRPESISKRTFVLSCPEMNGNFISNEVTVDVRVLHRSRLPPPVLHYGAAGAHAGGQAVVHRAGSRLVSRHHPAPAAPGRGGGVNAGVVVVLAICAGFFVLLVTLAAIRIASGRARQSGSGPGPGAHRLVPGEAAEKIYRPPTEDEMEWDHSAMTITVNPMEMETYNAQPCQQCVESEDESSLGLRQDTDLSCSEDDDDLDDDYEEERETASAMASMDQTAARNDKGELEWDNCSLPPFTHPPTRDPVNV